MNCNCKYKRYYFYKGTDGIEVENKFYKKVRLCFLNKKYIGVNSSYFYTYYIFSYLSLIHI